MLSYLMSLFPITVSTNGSYFDASDFPLFSNPKTDLKAEIMKNNPGIKGLWVIEDGKPVREVKKG